MTNATPGQSWRIPWEGAAQKLGIQVVAREGPPGQEPSAMEGVVDGFTVLISIEEYRNQGERTVVQTHYLVELPVAAQYPFRKLSPRRGKRVWGRSFRSGDSQWDRRFVVKTDNKDGARLYLTSERRSVLDRVNQLLPPPWRLTHQGLSASTKRYAAQYELVETVETLIECAKELESASIAR